MSDPTGGDEVPDIVSSARAYEFPPEAVVSRWLRDEIATLEEQAGSDPLGLYSKLIGVVGRMADAVFALEGQIIELRREVRGG